MPVSMRYTCFLAGTYFTFLCSRYFPLQPTLILCHKLKRKSHIFACLIYEILRFEFHEVLVRLKNRKFDQNHDFLENKNRKKVKKEHANCSREMRGLIKILTF